MTIAAPRTRSGVRRRTRASRDRGRGLFARARLLAGGYLALAVAVAARLGPLREERLRDDHRTVARRAFLPLVGRPGTRGCETGNGRTTRPARTTSGSSPGCPSR